MTLARRIDQLSAIDRDRSSRPPFDDPDADFCPPGAPWELPEFGDDFGKDFDDGFDETEPQPEDGDFWIEPDDFDP